MSSQPRGYTFGHVKSVFIIFVVTREQLINVVMHVVNIKVVCLTSHHFCLASALIYAQDDSRLPQARLLYEGQLIWILSCTGSE